MLWIILPVVGYILWKNSDYFRVTIAYLVLSLIKIISGGWR